MFEKSKLTYGEEATTALPLVAGELEPGLPAPGVAGTIPAITVVSSEVAAWLSEPKSQILPSEKWPPEVPKARMNCSKAEWNKVALLLWKRKMVKAIRKKDIFHVQGKPVVNGAFAVLKKGTPAKA